MSDRTADGGPRHFARLGFALSLSLLLAGCTLGPDFERPQAPEAKGYVAEGKQDGAAVASDGIRQKLLQGKDVPGEWWRLFRSPALNRLIEKALKRSPDLQAASAALREARENAVAEESGLFPSISANGNGLRQKTAGALFGNPNFSGTTFTLYNASVKVSYTLDVFGAIRRTIEAFNAQAEYQQYQLQGAVLSLSSNLATTAIREASLRGQIAATEEVMAAQQQQLDLIARQVDLGAASQLDLLSQRTALEQTRASLPPLRQQLAQARHALRVLAGDFPSDDLAAQFNLSDLRLPQDLPLSLPSKLVEQRPDVRAQESLLHAASAQIGVATAHLLPDFTLEASAGTIATKMGDLFMPGSGIWNTGLNILQPVFHGGELFHKREAAIAAYEQAAAQYRSTVLQALQNVADTLRALQNDAATLAAQQAAEQSASETWQLAQAQYATGAISYLSTLKAQSDYQQSRIGRVQAEAARLADTAALFQALGGGWWNRADPALSLAAPAVPD
ncbi:efflux transporter outer membrane subunit [Methyloterricola oryzae]|uniref:efflux transporter outer membrane subunit n=1 Tax=Methyloterricola oryzae TaxID=1495050 RepID=UPI0009E29C6B|nr:efflux transporter outer membrane subunit [Methyloterricola oryzae]